MLFYDDEEIDAEIIRSRYSYDADIQFISYTGYDPYCNLCHGELVLSIDEQVYSFGQRQEYHSFFAPILCESNCGWETDVLLLPDELVPYAKRIDEVINANMPTCCCNGCD